MPEYLIKTTIIDEEMPKELKIQFIDVPSWSIGVLPQNNIEYSSIIAVSNTIYIAGGWEINGSVRNNKVWKLEF